MNAPRPTAVVADDEPLLRAQLISVLRECWPELEVVAEAANGVEAVHAVREHQPALAFLDIEMPVLNGLDAARTIGEGPHLVFVTAYDRYAVEAFERGAVDYVLKPATPERMRETVRRLQARMAAPAQPLDALLAELARRVPAAAPPLEWLQASVGTTIKLINVNDVLYFRSDAKYTRVVTAEGESLVRKPLKDLIAELDPRRFWQVHRSILVSVNAIDRVLTDDMGKKEIVVKGSAERLEVSRTFAHLFRAS